MIKDNTRRHRSWTYYLVRLMQYVNVMDASSKDVFKQKACAEGLMENALLRHSRFITKGGNIISDSLCVSTSTLGKRDVINVFIIERMRTYGHEMDSDHIE